MYSIVSWLVNLIFLGLSILGWGQDFGWNLLGFSAYEWFPLFGLIAFTLMWGHYTVDFIGQFMGFRVEEGTYLKVTRYIVFFCLLMHPSLLAWQRWHDGFGLPPSSWISFAGDGASLGIILGITAWLAFLAFELHYWFRNKSWFRWVVMANSVAMLLIVVHVIYLVDPSGWFLYLWYFYGASLIMFFAKDFYDQVRAKGLPNTL